MNNILVREVQSGKTLKAFSYEDEELAYKYIIEMEELGLDVQLMKPSVTQSLGHCLGATNSEIESLKQEENEELESHHESCCFESTTDH